MLWQLRRFRRTLVWGIVAVLVLDAPGVVSAPFPITPEGYPFLSDWPSIGRGLDHWYRQWLAVTGARERQRTAPASPTTVGWLARAGLLDDALDALGRVVEEQPRQMAEAFQQFGSNLGSDQARDRRPKAREILAAAHARV